MRFRNDVDKHLDISTTSMDFESSSLGGESQLQAHLQVQQVSNDTEHGGKRRREGGKSGIGRLERMKRGNGTKV